MKKLEALRAEDLKEGTLGKRLFLAFMRKGESLSWFCKFAGISEKRMIGILKDEKEINLQEMRYAVIDLRLSEDETRMIFFPPEPAGKIIPFPV